MLKEAVIFIIDTCLATCILWPDHVVYNVNDTIFVRYCHIAQTKNQVEFMNISTERIIQSNQSEPLSLH